MTNTNTNPTEGVTKESSVNVIEKFNLTGNQIKIILDMIDKYIESELKKTSNTINYHISNNDEKRLPRNVHKFQNLFSLRMGLLHVRSHCGLLEWNIVNKVPKSGVKKSKWKKITSFMSSIK